MACSSSDILLLGNRFKVRRINTVTNATKVIEPKSGGNGAVDRLVEPAMSYIGNAILRKFSVATAILCSDPQPTGFSLGNLGPEAFFSSDGSECHSTSSVQAHPVGLAKAQRSMWLGAIRVQAGFHSPILAEAATSV
jgi:hypothetical protein